MLMQRQVKNNKDSWIRSVNGFNFDWRSRRNSFICNFLLMWGVCLQLHHVLEKNAPKASTDNFDGSWNPFKLESRQCYAVTRRPNHRFFYWTDFATSIPYRVRFRSSLLDGPLNRGVPFHRFYCTYRIKHLWEPINTLLWSLLRFLFLAISTVPR